MKQGADHAPVMLSASQRYVPGLGGGLDKSLPIPARTRFCATVMVAAPALGLLPIDTIKRGGLKFQARKKQARSLALS